MTAFQRQRREGWEDSIEAEAAMLRRELDEDLGEGTAQEIPCDGKELDLSRQKPGGQCGQSPVDKRGRCGQTGDGGVERGRQNRRGLTVLVRSWDLIPSVIGSPWKVLNRGSDLIYVFEHFEKHRPTS